MTAALIALETMRRRAWLESRDPRVRLGAALIGVMAIVGIHRLETMAVGLVAALLLVWAGGVGIGELRRRLGHLEGVVAVALLFVPLSVPGPSVLTLGPIVLSGPGLARAGLIALKLNAAAMVLLALVGGLSPLRLAQALAAFGAPDRLVRILLFAVRYVGLLRDETTRLLTAAKARGFRPTTSRHTVATIGLVLGTTLIRALERAERIGEAMRCRGFSGHFILTAPPPLRWRDYMLVACAAALAALFLVGDRVL